MKSEKSAIQLARQIQHDIYEGFYDEGAKGLVEFEIPGPCAQTINELSFDLAERAGVTQQAARNALTRMVIDDFFARHAPEEIAAMLISKGKNPDRLSP
ncbi:MAG TPA: hypothetical protein VMH87_13795 [Pseudomonadales bacterium]|nr:hypothetical protein [Pseudomonadales bacterium]